METQKHKQETKLLEKYYKLIKKKKLSQTCLKHTYLLTRPIWKTNKKNVHKIIVPWVKFGTNQTLL